MDRLGPKGGVQSEKEIYIRKSTIVGFTLYEKMLNYPQRG